MDLNHPFYASDIRFNERRVSLYEINKHPAMERLKYATPAGMGAITNEQVWRSRYIESILLRMPLQPIYLYRWFGDENWGVIDGLKRLYAIRFYMHGWIDIQASDLTTGMEWLGSWDTLNHSLQRRIEETELTIIYLTLSREIESDDDIRRDVLSRLFKHIRGRV